MPISKKARSALRESLKKSPRPKPLYPVAIATSLHKTCLYHSHYIWKDSPIIIPTPSERIKEGQNHQQPVNTALNEKALE
ncbi:hypothetical protein BLX87_17365 [Bacillus sp. VT-16-64]|nr:hypothetical protein BLX87_17365 [Bacillus sp. VT-16-64]